MLIDTHAHLNFRAYKNDIDKVIRRTFKENIWVVNVGSRYETSRKAVEIAEKYSQGIYAAVGLHPIYAGADFVKIKTDSQEGDFKIREEDFDREKYKELARSDKVVAIGEIGLDYYYRPKTKTKLEKFKEKQKQVFREQLDLAKELNLSVIFHCRMAHQDLLDILNSKLRTPQRKAFGFLRGRQNSPKEFRFQRNPTGQAKPQLKSQNYQNYNIKGVIHCFTGTWEQAQRYLNMGFYLGFNGIIYKMDLEEVIKKTPIERILVETDCPYLTPSEQEDKPIAISSVKVEQCEDRRNEPIFIKHIVKKIAEIKDINFKQVAETTTLNAGKLFNI